MNDPSECPLSRLESIPSERHVAIHLEEWKSLDSGINARFSNLYILAGLTLASLSILVLIGEAGRTRTLVLIVAPVMLTSIAIIFIGESKWALEMHTRCISLERELGLHSTGFHATHSRFLDFPGAKQMAIATSVMWLSVLIGIEWWALPGLPSFLLQDEYLILPAIVITALAIVGLSGREMLFNLVRESFHRDDRPQQGKLPK